MKNYWEEITIYEYKNLSSKDSYDFSNKEKELIKNGIDQIIPDVRHFLSLHDNCYLCRGYGIDEYRETCRACRGSACGSTIEAKKITDGYYLIYYRAYNSEKAFKIDGFSNFLAYWIACYSTFVGRGFKQFLGDVDADYLKKIIDLKLIYNNNRY